MRPIAKDVFHIPLMPRNSMNSYWIEGFLVDAGIRGSARRLIRHLATRPAHTHVLTHAHADHQGSSLLLHQKLGLPVWCSERDRPLAESGQVTVEYPDPRHPIARFQQRYWAGPGVPISKTLKEGDQLGTFCVIETPGHARGHVSFFREKDGVLIAGDVATNMDLLTTWTGLREPPYLFTNDQAMNRQSLQKLAQLHPRIVCFGHGPVLYNRGEFEAFVAGLGHWLR